MNSLLGAVVSEENNSCLYNSNINFLRQRCCSHRIFNKSHRSRDFR